MSCNVIPFFLRDVASYRMWLNKTADPHVLRDVGRCACDDLEEALTALDKLAQEGSHGRTKQVAGMEKSKCQALSPNQSDSVHLDSGQISNLTDNVSAYKL